MVSLASRQGPFGLIGTPADIDILLCVIFSRSDKLISPIDNFNGILSFDIPFHSDAIRGFFFLRWFDSGVIGRAWRLTLLCLELNPNEVTLGE